MATGHTLHRTRIPGMSLDALRRRLDQRPRWVLTAKFVVLFAVFFLVSFHKLDPDFGWHLQAGNYIRTHGIPAHDIFTYTARQFPWIDHEWGNDIILSVVYGWGGYALAAVLYGTLWALGLLVAGGRRLSVLTLAALAVIPYAGIRPVAWTVLLLAITFRVLKSGNRRLVWLLPLMFILWANVHAGFIIGLLMILYMAVYDRRPALLGVFGLSALATLLNAYGPRLYVEIARTMFDPALHSQVGEWAPFSFQLSAIVFVALWGVGMVFFERRTLWQWLRPSVILLLAAMSATRNVPLFVVGALGEANGYALRTVRAVPRNLTWAAKWWLGGWLAVAFGVVFYCAFTELWPLRAGETSTYPVQAVAYLKANGCQGGNIFNDYDYGGYLIWKLPTQPVYIDGRMPSWKDPSGQKYMTEYYALLRNPARYHKVSQKYNIRCSLLQRTSRNLNLIRLLQHNHWRTVVQTPYSVLQVAPRQ